MVKFLCMLVYSEQGRNMSVQYVVNDQRKPIQVLLDLADYEGLLDRVEDTEAVAMLEEMKMGRREYMSFEELAKSIGVHV